MNWTCFLYLPRHAENVLQQNDSLDFIFLQEVDKKARRSFHENQVEMLAELMPAFESVFAVNYDVKFVPLPSV